MDMKERTRNRDQKRLLEPEEDADARARSGCSCQKWMLVPGLDAMREQGLRNLPKGEDYQRTDWSRHLYSLGDPFRVKAAET